MVGWWSSTNSRYSSRSVELVVSTVIKWTRLGCAAGVFIRVDNVGTASLSLYILKLNKYLSSPTSIVT